MMFAAGSEALSRLVSAPMYALACRQVNKYTTPQKIYFFGGGGCVTSGYFHR
jgi:hypothetical protein